MNLQFWSVFQKLKELAAVMKVVSKEPCSYGQFSLLKFYWEWQLYIRTGSLLLRTALMSSKNHLDNSLGFGAISDTCKKTAWHYSELDIWILSILIQAYKRYAHHIEEKCTNKKCLVNSYPYTHTHTHTHICKNVWHW
jgi:hypothetical protein